MITGQDIRLEIGGRTLLHDGSFLIANADKVGLVGRNGAGKSSLIHFVLGDTPSHFAVRGTSGSKEPMAIFPRSPCRVGSGSMPAALSHVLSARGLDALDDRLHKAQAAMADSPTDEVIHEYTTLEERYRAAGGYEMEGQIARLADGLGLHQDLLFEDVSTLSGGQRRRVDLMRVLFQAPDTLILDEPTNHLDLAAKRWLIDELRSLPERCSSSATTCGSSTRPSPRCCTWPMPGSDSSRARYSSFRAQLGTDIAQREKAASMEDAADPKDESPGRQVAP